MVCVVQNIEKKSKMLVKGKRKKKRKRKGSKAHPSLDDVCLVVTFTRGDGHDLKYASFLFHILTILLNRRYNRVH